MAGVKIDNFQSFPYTIPEASTVSDGVMSVADKIKLDALNPSTLATLVVVADSSLLTAALAGSLPQYTMALALSSRQIFVTEDNITWKAYTS